MGWYGAVRVDGQTFAWLGENHVDGVNDTVIEDVVVTPTRSNFIVIAGPARLNITFLSPIEVRCLSLPLSL
jgi:hypothetical protein